ncbi:hypothetical protein PROFUN_12881 [Planoprotostelium fungivorum]|uniref:Sialate O-acetylesterase domain-containing protein n=1 Tax=Planoprotostelium fungivorum TaxID=1890364 RepID=A0A2P6MWP8_9EUKA|nr:hypothetical protein PROFUN_12881 [Planoprotostelium fungivorum]
MPIEDVSDIQWKVLISHIQSVLMTLLTSTKDLFQLKEAIIHQKDIFIDNHTQLKMSFRHSQKLRQIYFNQVIDILSGVDTVDEDLLIWIYDTARQESFDSSNVVSLCLKRNFPRLVQHMWDTAPSEMKFPHLFLCLCRMKKQESSEDAAVFLLDHMREATEHLDSETWISLAHLFEQVKLRNRMFATLQSGRDVFGRDKSALMAEMRRILLMAKLRHTDNLWSRILLFHLFTTLCLRQQTHKMHRALVSLLLLFALFDGFLCLNFVSNTLGSHMVLQRAPQRARLWGWTVAKQNVSLKMVSKSATFETATRSSDDGSWEISLPPTPAGGPYVITLKAEHPDHVAELTDILFGDVYICSGQSNMGFTVPKSFNATEERKKANHYPNIRLFSAAQKTATTEQRELLGTALNWSGANETTVGTSSGSGYFSAACWFFGRDVYDATHIPIGLIASAWGGTPIQFWTPPTTNKLCNDTTKTPVNGLWNAMGEQNAGHADYYACAFPAMISSWRTYFGENLPFYFVQLATWSRKDNDAISELRLSQASALSLPFTGMASAIDLSDPKSPYGEIHPRNKQEVGRRLSLLALHEIYRHRVPHGGPVPIIFQQVKNTGGNVRVDVSFDPDTLAGGLVMVDVKCPVGPEQCGAVAEILIDKKWTKAGYQIERGVLALTLNSTGKALGVRYAHANYPLCAVYNQAGLPLTPFVHNF